MTLRRPLLPWRKCQAADCPKGPARFGLCAEHYDQLLTGTPVRFGRWRRGVRRELSNRAAVRRSVRRHRRGEDNWATSEQIRAKLKALIEDGPP